MPRPPGDGESQKGEVREQIAGLEAELKEEKEATENLSELANERREQITKLTEQVEEANERYEEAKWRLGKTARFERLVRRRKGLINALLEALRAKNKGQHGFEGRPRRAPYPQSHRRGQSAEAIGARRQLEGRARGSRGNDRAISGLTLGKEQLATATRARRARVATQHAGRAD